MPRVLRVRIQDAGFWSIVSRFPVPAVCAVLLWISALLLIEAREAATWRADLIEAAAQHLVPFLAMACVFSFAAQLYGEATGSRLRAWAAQVLGLAALAVGFDIAGGLRLLVAPSEADILVAAIIAKEYAQPPAFMAGLFAVLVLLPFMAPYARYEVRPGAFWQFSQKLAFATLAAIAGAALVFSSIEAVFFTAEILFRIDVSMRISMHAASLSFLLGAPFVLLALTPANFEELPGASEAREFTSRTVSLLTRFILIPLVSILSAMLLAFALLVIVQGRFSSARLGINGLLYGVGIVATALLAYPDIEESRIARIFWRFWPWFLIPPTVMLVPSILIRIEEYGWTPFRYFMLLAGVWMALVAVACLRWRHELRTIPGILAVLLMLAIVGPWSVMNVTGRSQARQLEAALTAKGLLADGKWRKPAPLTWRGSEERAIVSSLDALAEAGQLHRLRPWFEGVADNPFAGAGGWREAIGRKLAAGGHPGFYLSPPATAAAPAPVEPPAFLSFYTPKPRVLKIPSDGILLGPIETYSSPSALTSIQLTSPAGRLEVRVKGKTIEVSDAGGKTARFGLDALLSDVKNSQKPVAEEQREIALADAQMRLLEGEGNLKAKAAIAEAKLNLRDDALHTELFLILPAK